ncbi:hypothetical protein V6N11_068615 [Hibiscus sabdariffa]|uniref:LITAF domain-containing protein n=1 Tax=Hibiscus sabdariffa TaxID=183260 RepID=A0ABR2PAN3_9ROSI
MNPYQQSFIYGDPGGIPIRQTMFHDTPAPFRCPYCGNSGLTFIRSKLSLAAMVACTMPFMLGICFLCPSMDCLWHKYHYCPHCAAKVKSGSRFSLYMCVIRLRFDRDLVRWFSSRLANSRKRIRVWWSICHNGCRRVMLFLLDRQLGSCPGIYSASCMAGPDYAIGVVNVTNVIVSITINIKIKKEKRNRDRFESGSYCFDFDRVRVYYRTFKANILLQLSLELHWPGFDSDPNHAARAISPSTTQTCIKSIL